MNDRDFIKQFTDEVRDAMAIEPRKKAEQRFAQAEPKLGQPLRIRTPSPTFGGGTGDFLQSDKSFAETLLMVLVHQDLLWARSGRADEQPMPRIMGNKPRRVERERINQAQMNTQLPPGGFDILRREFRAELHDWENFAEEVVIENDRNLKQAAISSLLVEIEHLFATVPGPDVPILDAVSAVQEGIEYVIGKFYGDEIATAVGIVASIIINHVTTAMAKSDMQERRQYLETILVRDGRLLTNWKNEIYQINLIDEYYSLWLELVPNEELLGFRLPVAPEYHSENEFSNAFGRSFELIRAKREQPQQAISEFWLFDWLQERGIKVRDEEDLRRILSGTDWVRAFINNTFFFPSVALRPQVKVMQGDFILVRVTYSSATESSRREPDGIFVLHERTASTFLYRFEDKLYHDPRPQQR